jgi:ribosomal protein S18 acetylase RimI-like enzyme
MIIRFAVPEDFEAFSRLAGQGLQLHVLNVPDIFQTADTPGGSREYFREYLANPSSAVFVAEEDGHMVGYVKVATKDAPNFPIFLPKRILFVSDIEVDKKYARSGIGRALMEKATEWGKAKNCFELQLDVHAFNEVAQSFYRKLGFEVIVQRLAKKID